LIWPEFGVVLFCRKGGLCIKPPKPLIIVMEVHHHPDLHHKRKNFREYFLEFLMIFLAVTLGFFAESMRENMAEKRKKALYILFLQGA
jgi:hypothetical protein